MGDLHLRERTPASRLDNYRETSFEELAAIRDIALERKADAVFCTGDIFDDPAATRNPHSLVLQTIRMFKSFHCPVYSVIGNHDISYHRQDTIEKQPLGVLFESGALKKLDREVMHGIEVVGVHFDEKNTYETLRLKKSGKSPLIAICHVLAAPEEADMFGETIFGYNEMSEGSEVDCYVFGHFHNDQGIIKTAGKSFVNLGAIARGALNSDVITRKVKLGLIEYDGLELNCSEILLPVRPVEEIFDLDKKKELQDREKEIEQFVASLAKNEIFENLSNLEEVIKKKNLEPKVKSRVIGYLNGRGAEIPQ